MRKDVFENRSEQFSKTVLMRKDVFENFSERFSKTVRDFFEKIIWILFSENFSDIVIRKLFGREYARGGGLLLPLLLCKVESMGRRAEFPKRARISGENREIWGKTLPGAKEARFRGKRSPDSPGCGSRRCGTRGFPQGDATERLCENLAIVAISTEKVAVRPPPGNHTVLSISPSAFSLVTLLVYVLTK